MFAKFWNPTASDRSVRREATSSCKRPPPRRPSPFQFPSIKNSNRAHSSPSSDRANSTEQTSKIDIAVKQIRDIIVKYGLAE
jgi:hypothetical protein